MADDILKHLYDIREAASAIRQFVEDKSFQEYGEDELLQSGVERKFEIIGEALNRIKNDDPTVLDGIRESRSIISFRNILIHGYDAVEQKIVWGIIEEDLDNLIEDIDELIDKNRASNPHR
jgi:uncharacterized protein with HEPN domain